MSVKDQISADLKEAMKARDQVRLDTLRSVLSAFTYRRVEAGHDLGDDEQLAVVQKQVKQRNDSIVEYEKAGRAELVAKEARERDILARYLPAQKSADEVREIVRRIVSGLPSDGRNQGAVMKAVMPQLKGQADGNIVRQVVTEELSAASAGS
ncbi:MAG: GatB/YqeY domain-containing protein [Candidatus Velthaea sp.]